MLFVLFQSLGIHNDITKEYSSVGTVLLENSIHENIKCCKSIGKAKWHYQILIQTKLCPKGSLMDVFRYYPYLMVPAFKINPTIIIFSFKLIKNVLNLGNWEPIFDCLFV